MAPLCQEGVNCLLSRLFLTVEVVSVLIWGYGGVDDDDGVVLLLLLLCVVSSDRKTDRQINQYTDWMCTVYRLDVYSLQTRSLSTWLATGPYDTTRCTTSTAVRIDRYARYLLFFPNLEFTRDNRKRPPAVIRSLRPSEELAEGTKMKICTRWSELGAGSAECRLLKFCVDCGCLEPRVTSRYFGWFAPYSPLIILLYCGLIPRLTTCESEHWRFLCF